MSRERLNQRVTRLGYSEWLDGAFTDAAKLTRRARHRVLAIDEIDQVVTDNKADADALSAMRKASVDVHHG